MSISDINEKVKPESLRPIFENIPEELKKENRWVAWKYEWRKNKWTKPPFTHKGFYASLTNPSTWASFDEINKFYLEHSAHDNLGKVEGIGYVLGDGHSGLDLDHVNFENLSDFQNSVLDLMKTYTEVSPSNKGLRLICRASIERAIKLPVIEIYDKARFLTITGHKFNNFEISERQDQLNKIITQLPIKPTNNHESNGHKWEIDILDDEILEIALRDDKFAKLYNGKWQEFFPSQSEADASLAAKIVYFTSDKVQIDRIFNHHYFIGINGIV